MNANKNNDSFTTVTSVTKASNNTWSVTTASATNHIQINNWSPQTISTSSAIPTITITPTGTTTYSTGSIYISAISGGSYIYGSNSSSIIPYFSISIKDKLKKYSYYKLKTDCDSEIKNNGYRYITEYPNTLEYKKEYKNRIIYENYPNKVKPNRESLLFYIGKKEIEINGSKKEYNIFSDNKGGMYVYKFIKPQKDLQDIIGVYHFYLEQIKM